MNVKNLIVHEGKPPVSFEHPEDRCCVICSKQDEDTTLLLRKIGGLEHLSQSEEVIFGSLLPGVDNRVVRFFFKQGILLSNLTLKENIALPYQFINPESCWGDFEDKVSEWINYFHLDIDLDLRPASVNHSSQKLVAYIRNLILIPDIYVLDDPFFQLSSIYRKKVVDCLQLLKDDNNFLVIGTTDVEIIEHLADDVIIIHKGDLIGRYTLTGNNRASGLNSVYQYLDL